MKNLKILSVLILALSFVACEQEQIDSPELDSEISEIKFIQIDENGVISSPKEKPQLNFSQSKAMSTGDYRLYSTFEELENDCSDLINSGFDHIGVTSFTIGFGLNSHYFGGTVEVEDEEDLVTITVRNKSYEIIFQEDVLVNTPTYFGIATVDEIGQVSLSASSANRMYLRTFQYSTTCLYILDTDGDGVPDDEDLMPNSNMEAAVMIDGCDSGVDNIALGDGIMLSDKIDELEAGEYRNHGQYVKDTVQYLAELVGEGIISQEEKDMIMECAGESSIG